MQRKSKSKLGGRLACLCVFLLLFVLMNYSFIKGSIFRMTIVVPENQKALTTILGMIAKHVKSSVEVPELEGGVGDNLKGLVKTYLKEEKNQKIQNFRCNWLRGKHSMLLFLLLSQRRLLTFQLFLQSYGQDGGAQMLQGGSKAPKEVAEGFGRRL